MVVSGVGSFGVGPLEVDVSAPSFSGAGVEEEGPGAALSGAPPEENSPVLVEGTGAGMEDDASAADKASDEEAMMND